MTKIIIQVGDLFVTDYRRGGFNSSDVGTIALRDDVAQIFHLQTTAEEVAAACHGNIVYIEQ